jgi:hypothetical protein
MKIDMIYVWAAGLLLVMLFQNFFTVKKTDYDVLYSYTTNEMGYIAYGQTTIVCTGNADLDWASLRVWLVKDVKARTGEDSAVVTVLGTNKRDSDRYWRPFWMVISSV